VSDRGAFNGLFVPDRVADATSERAWLQAMGPDGIEQALDPLRYLGSADAFVDRALARYAEDGT
jgi:hypothetical protein